MIIVGPRSGRSFRWLLALVITCVGLITTPAPPVASTGYGYDTLPSSDIHASVTHSPVAIAIPGPRFRQWAASPSAEARGASPSRSFVATELDPGRIRFSQSSVNDVGEVAFEHAGQRMGWRAGRCRSNA